METLPCSKPLLLALVAFMALASALQAQQPAAPGPSSALSSALAAACHEDENEFAKYLDAGNAAAFEKLPATERVALMRRFVLLDAAGRPLLSSDEQGHAILRCEATDATAEFRFGVPRVHENLAFVPVTAVGNETIQFGLVRQAGGWKLLSLGLLLIDIPQLEKQWAAGALEAREQAAISALHTLAEAIDTYRRAFGKLPESLAQLGPAKNGVSPDAAQLVSAGLAAGSSGGYEFRYRIVSPSYGGQPGFELAAIPADYGKSGRRSFLLTADGKLHGADDQGALATSDDPLIHASGETAP